MKIPPANPLPARPAPETQRPTNRRGQLVTDSPAADDPAETFESSGAPERDFASVFDEVVSRPERQTDEAGEGDLRASRETERPEHDGAARRHEEREGGSDQTGGDSKGGGFEHRAALRETTSAGEATNARAILHVADLERIVSAVRAQVADGGRVVVTVELRRSVLEGLKVKLSADGAGRVTAEFIAASERVRAQLDTRAAELAELLRGRGVNLAAMRTSVEAGGGGEGGPTREDLPRAVGEARAASPRAALPTSADAPAAEPEGGAPNTYRA
jgi:hypothetical protein